MTLHMTLFFFLTLVARLVLAKTAARLIVFKRAASGSTWFADLLRHESWCGHFVSEANTCPHIKNSSQELLTWMTETLVGNFTPLSRKPKCDATKLDWQDKDKMIGFSIEPESSFPVITWASYGTLLALPRTWAVFYVRTNLVKHFVAKEHKRQSFNTICGTSKSFRAEARDCIQQNGIDKERFAVNATILVRGTYGIAESYARSLATIKGLARLHTPVVVTYEALLLDPGTVLRGLAEIVGIRALSFDTLDSPSIKITSDDLRDSISNFDELHSALRGKHRHPQLSQQLRETTPIAHTEVCLFRHIDRHHLSDKSTPQSECDSFTIGE